MRKPAVPARVTLQPSYLRHLADQVRALDADVGAWLSRCGLSEADLTSHDALDLEAFRALVRDAVETTREPALGLLVGQRLGMAAHGIVGLAAVSSASLGEGLEILVRYAGLRTTLVSVALEAVARRVRVRFEVDRALGELRAPVLEAAVLSVKNALDATAGDAVRVDVVAFAFPAPAPAHAALARALFAAEVRYAASWTGFELPAEALNRPLAGADPEASREAQAVCQRQLERRRADEPVAARVRRTLLGPERIPPLHLTARLLHVSPRTLHRRLVAEGTSYRAIVEDVRHALAVDHLRSGRSGVEEIAHRLGYSDVANFRRAFKRWERVPPAAFRKAHAGGAAGVGGPPGSRARVGRAD